MNLRQGDILPQTKGGFAEVTTMTTVTKLIFYLFGLTSASQRLIGCIAECPFVDRSQVAWAC